MGAEKGEKPRGRVEEGAVAASGPGMETTDQSADGVGLATPASSPTAGRQVNEKTADTINPNAMSAGPTEPADRSPGPAVEPGPPRRESYTTSHDRTPPSEDASGGEVQEVAASHEVATGDEVEGGGTDDEDRRAHERIDDERSRVETSEDETVTTTISASAPSASCDHPDEDAVTTDPARPSRDPEDATGNDERRPDAPTEPPDMPGGTRGRGSREGVETEVSRGPNRAAEATGGNGDETRRPEKPDGSPNEVEGARVEEVETSVLQASKDIQDGPGDGDNDERRPERPAGPSDEPSVERRDPADVQVEPGGATEAERNGSAAHDDADAEVDREVARACRDAESRWRVSR